MGAWTCQYGTVHKRCRCPQEHKMTCPEPYVCRAKRGGKHRADRPTDSPSLATGGPEVPDSGITERTLRRARR